ncbi:MAG: hypothetical protein H7Z12_08075 [Rhodospirillaceae bacterium]|nr:hypothetical protein [Rhodospirillales bacterium]
MARRLLPNGSVVLLSDFGRDRYDRLLATITLTDGLVAGFLIAVIMVARAFFHGFQVQRDAPTDQPKS